MKKNGKMSTQSNRNDFREIPSNLFHKFPQTIDKKNFAVQLCHNQEIIGITSKKMYTLQQTTLNINVLTTYRVHRKFTLHVQ